MDNQNYDTNKFNIGDNVAVKIPNKLYVGVISDIYKNTATGKTQYIYKVSALFAEGGCVYVEEKDIVAHFIV